MYFKYVGGNDSTECFGISFPKDKPVDVQDTRAISKLTNNTAFQKVDGRTKAVKKNDKSPAS